MGPHGLFPVTSSFTVSLSCRDSLARTSSSPACSAVDLNQDWPVCELRTVADAKALGYLARIVGAVEVILYALFTD